MNIKVNEITTTMLFIGFEGEQNHAIVQFDCASVFAEYPEATVYMTIEPPTGSIYPKEVTRNGNIVEWVVSAGDCAYPGKGMYQITFTSGNVIVKSFVGNYVVRDSLIANGNPPDPVDEWIEQAEDLLNEFENISASAETLEPGTQATAEMTEVDGHKNIAFGIPQGEKGNIGLTPDISIGTVETGEAGTDASASMTGTPENPVLNLTIPRGNPGEVTEAELKEVADSKAPVIIDSASGAIASFTDGADNLPVEDCVVQIEPVQDLHGQNSPYPAGGGKNIANFPVDQTIPLTDVPYTVIDFGEDKTIANCCLSFFATNAIFSNEGGAICDYLLNDGTHQYRIATAYGMTKDASNTGQFSKTETNITFRKLNVFLGTNYSQWLAGKISIQFELSSTATSFAPYSNICPITGWTGANVVRTGKNLLNLSDNRQGSFDSTTVANNVSTDVYLAIKGGQYIWSTALSVIGGRYIRFYDKDKTLLSNDSISLYGTGNKTFTAPQNATYFRAMWFRNTGITPSDITADQIELGSTATTYEQYHGTTYPISFESAGTVYGGELDVTTGVLKVTHKSVDMGSISWSKSSSVSSVGGTCFTRALSYIGDGMAQRVRYAKNTMLCSQYATCDANMWFINNMPDFAMMSNESAMYITDSRYSDATSFITAVTGIPLIYELATPVTYQLTPTEIKTLLGQNNIFADTGDASVQYRADTKLFIMKLISSLQQ